MNVCAAWANLSVFEIGYFMRPKLTHHEADEGHEGATFSELRVLRAFVVKCLLPNFAFFAILTGHSPVRNYLWVQRCAN